MPTYVPEPGQEYPPDRLDREFQGIKRVLDEVPQADDWRDILGQIQTRGVGSSDPDWTSWGGGSPFSAFKFSIGDECWIPYHVPHDITPDEPVYFHVHWTTNGTQTNTVKWEYTYTDAKGFDQGNFSTTGTTITSEQAAAGTAWRHMVSETAAESITGLTEPDGIVYLHLERITNGGTENTDNVFVLLADLHYRSSNQGTVGKAPNFYRY